MKIEIPYWLFNVILLAVLLMCMDNVINTIQLKSIKNELQNIAGYCEHGEEN